MITRSGPRGLTSSPYGQPDRKKATFTTPFSIDLGSLGLSEFDAGLDQLYQRKFLLSFCHAKLSLKCLFAFPQGGHDGHCAAGVPAPLDEGVWAVLGRPAQLQEARLHQAHSPVQR